MHNKQQIIGNLGGDPEVKTFDNGGKIVQFSVASTDKWKDKDGNPQEHTEWFDCKVTMKGLAGVAEKYLKKGSKVFLEGKTRTETWEKDGETQYRKRVMINNLVMLGSDGGSNSAPQSKPSNATHSAPPIDSDEDDDLPF